MKNGLSLNIASVPTLAPSGVFPSLALNFLNTETLSSLVTFTRASSGTYTDSTGVLRSAAVNLLLRSEEFDNAAWSKSNTAISGTNTVLAPDNTLSGEEVRDGTASGLHNVFQAVSVVAGTTYAFSCYLQNVDRQFASLAVSTGTSQYAGAKFDLVAGAAGSTAAAGGGWSVVSSSITAVNNGWYRCTLTLVAGNTASANIRIGLATDGTTFTAAGSGLESYLGTDLKIALWGAQLETGSTATAYIPTTTAANSTPRFDYDPSTLASKGLLIEEQRTNLLTYSEQIDNAIWGKSNTTISANAGTAPTGAVTMDKIVEDSATSTHYIQSANLTISASSAVTHSFFVKAAGRNFCRLRLGDSVGFIKDAIFNLSTGTISAENGTGTATILGVGNGIYRITVSGTVNVAATFATMFLYLRSDATTESYTGDGSSGILAWGGQCEVGAFATSYIPTTTAAATRAADSAVISGASFTGFYNATQGTIYAEVVYGSVTVVGLRGFAIDDGTSSNAIRLAGVSAQVITGGATQVSMNTGVTLADFATFKAAFAYKANDFAASGNGLAAVTDAAGTVPVVDRLVLGASSGANTTKRVWVRRFTYYPTRLPNATLQALTV
jgi:hypothetical protein